MKLERTVAYSYTFYDVVNANTSIGQIELIKEESIVSKPDGVEIDLVVVDIDSVLTNLKSKTPAAVYVDREVEMIFGANSFIRKERYIVTEWDIRQRCDSACDVPYGEIYLYHVRKISAEEYLKVQ